MMYSKHPNLSLPVSPVLPLIVDIHHVPVRDHDFLTLSLENKVKETDRGSILLEMSISGFFF